MIRPSQKILYPTCYFNIARNQGEKAAPRQLHPQTLILLDLEAENRNELFKKGIDPEVNAGIVKI